MLKRHKTMTPFMFVSIHMLRLGNMLPSSMSFRFGSMFSSIQASTGHWLVSTTSFDWGKGFLRTRTFDWEICLLRPRFRLGNMLPSSMSFRLGNSFLRVSLFRPQASTEAKASFKQVCFDLTLALDTRPNLVCQVVLHPNLYIVRSLYKGFKLYLLDITIMG